MSKNQSNKFYIFLIIVLFINLLQAYFTPVIGDETYYWIYSKNLAWGYFDHPPMVALIIKISSFLFDKELGLRFLTPILNVLSIYFMWKLVPQKNKEFTTSVFIFYLILLAIPGFNLYGFITTPDVPLILFFVLYILAFQKMMKENTLLSAFLVGIFATLLLYSKYHGGILILLSVLLNIKTLKQRSIYIAGIIACVLIMPHLLWQINHDFVSFEYHLNQRPKGNIGIDNVLNFLGGFVGILNPLLFIPFFIFLIKQKFQIPKELQFYFKFLIGIFLFFLAFSFKTKIEAHWMVVAYIPFTIILHHLYFRFFKKNVFLKYLFILSILSIFILRIIVTLPLDWNNEFHKERENLFQFIAKKAGKKKVVFSNSYRNASKYTFYTGKPAISDNNYHYRKNQYDIGAFDTAFNNKEVLFLGSWPRHYLKTEEVYKNYNIYYRTIKKFPVFSNINAKLLNTNLEFQLNKQELNIEFKNNHAYDIYFDEDSMPIQIHILIENANYSEFYIFQHQRKILNKNSTQQIKGFVNINNIPSGKYKMTILLKADFLYPKKMSKTYDVEFYE